MLEDRRGARPRRRVRRRGAPPRAQAPLGSWGQTGTGRVDVQARAGSRRTPAATSHVGDYGRRGSPQVHRHGRVRAHVRAVARSDQARRGPARSGRTRATCTWPRAGQPAPRLFSPSGPRTASSCAASANYAQRPGDRSPLTEQIALDGCLASLYVVDKRQLPDREEFTPGRDVPAAEIGRLAARTTAHPDKLRARPRAPWRSRRYGTNSPAHGLALPARFAALFHPSGRHVPRRLRAPTRLGRRLSSDALPGGDSAAAPDGCSLRRRPLAPVLAPQHFGYDGTFLGRISGTPGSGPGLVSRTRLYLYRRLPACTLLRSADLDNSAVIQRLGAPGAPTCARSSPRRPPPSASHMTAPRRRRPSATGASSRCSSARHLPTAACKRHAPPARSRSRRPQAARSRSPGPDPAARTARSRSPGRIAPSIHATDVILAALKRHKRVTATMTVAAAGPPRGQRPRARRSAPCAYAERYAHRT